MNIKNNKNCKITINDEEISVSEKEKTADEMLEELGYKKKNLDIIFSRFWEEWENEDLAKTFSFNTEYEIIDITDENKYGITMQELQAINKKVQELGWI